MLRSVPCHVQAKLFPKYFALGVFAGILQMGTLAFGVPGGIAKAQLLTLGKPFPCQLNAD